MSSSGRFTISAALLQEQQGDFLVCRRSYFWHKCVAEEGKIPSSHFHFTIRFIELFLDMRDILTYVGQSFLWEKQGRNAPKTPRNLKEVRSYTIILLYCSLLAPDSQYEAHRSASDAGFNFSFLGQPQPTRFGTPSFEDFSECRQ